MDPSNIKQEANERRLKVLNKINQQDTGSSGSCLSSADIVTYLLSRIKKGSFKERDYLIVSKTSISEHFEKNEAISFQKEGLGLSVAVGLSLDLRNNKEKNWVYCLIEDSELLNGTTLEAALIAGREGLENLVLLIDNNQFAGDNKQKVDPLHDKLRSFGFKTFVVLNGHNIPEIHEGFEKAHKSNAHPVAIIFKTIKGKGVRFIENKGSYYHSPISNEVLIEANKDLC